MTPEQDTATDLQPEVEEPVVTEEQKEELEAAPKAEEETHEQYGKRVQDRINKLTKKLRDTEREMETIKSTTRSDFEAMTQHNQELKEAIAAMTTTANVIAEQTRPKPVDVTKEIDSSIKGLKAKRLEAYDNADFKMIAMIDDQLDELKDRKYEAKMAQELAKERESIEKKVTTAQKTDTQLNPTIEAWVEDTPWYNDTTRTLTLRCRRQP